MNIKIDWPARGHNYTKSEIDAVTQVLVNQKAALTQGDHVLKFEEKFAKYMGVKESFFSYECSAWFRYCSEVDRY